MTCENAETYLHQSLDEPLAQGERAALDAHFEGCPDCRREREAQRRLAQLAGRWASQTLASSDPGDAFNAQLLARLETPPKRSPLSLGLPLAATLLLLTALAALPSFPGASTRALAPLLYSLPHWLSINLLALPGDALALRRLPQTALTSSSWLSVLLPPAVGLNAVFCLRARQSALRGSVS